MAYAFIVLLIILSIISFFIVLLLGLMNFPLFVVFIIEVGILVTLLSILERLEKLEVSRNRTAEQKKYGQTRHMPGGTRQDKKSNVNRSVRKDQTSNSDIDDVRKEEKFKLGDIVYEKDKAVKLTVTDVKSNNRYELKDENDTILFRYHHELLKNKPNNI